MKKNSIIFVCMIALLLFSAGIVMADNGFMNDFNSTYGTTGTRLHSCNTCHTNSIPNLNSFGADWFSLGFGTRLNNEDSDGDGVNNITEINALTFPGDPNDPPQPPPQPPAAEPFCGDGFVDTNEGCDDGNNVDGDGCSADCVVERVPGCGDGILDPVEACDDGNNVAGDGCRGNCTEELCGDRIVDPQEDCDDGNNIDGDGCSADCNIERVQTPPDQTSPPAPPAGDEEVDGDDGDNSDDSDDSDEMANVVADEDDGDNDERDRRRPRRRDRRDRRSSDSDD